VSVSPPRAGRLWKHSFAVYGPAFFTALAEVVWLFNALAVMLRESLKTISNELKEPSPPSWNFLIRA
jgi:hypothetical protein